MYSQLVGATLYDSKGVGTPVPQVEAQGLPSTARAKSDGLPSTAPVNRDGPTGTAGTTENRNCARRPVSYITDISPTDTLQIYVSML